MAKQRSILTLLLIMACAIWPRHAFSQQTVLPPDQPEQDACHALSVCSVQFFPYSYQGIGRVSDLVHAVKSYAYEGRGQKQDVDVNDPADLVGIPFRGPILHRIVPHGNDQIRRVEQTIGQLVRDLSNAATEIVEQRR